MSNITFCPEKVCEEMREVAIRLMLFPDTDPKDILSGIVSNSGKFAGVRVGPREGSKALLKAVEINPEELSRKDGKIDGTFMTTVKSSLNGMIQDGSCPEETRKSLKLMLVQLEGLKTKIEETVVVQEKKS